MLAQGRSSSHKNIYIYDLLVKNGWFMGTMHELAVTALSPVPISHEVCDIL